MLNANGRKDSTVMKMIPMRRHVRGNAGTHSRRDDVSWRRRSFRGRGTLARCCWLA